MVANAFVRIFSKPETNVDKFAENNFSGELCASGGSLHQGSWFLLYSQGHHSGKNAQKGSLV